ncbi:MULTISPECIES: bifunctional 4-hydroxy-2-oxoglutarate aldolase/2-dehydro-3-deoxy-phosphogluconate aldolase [Mammaliicoccus]|jgi:2-dehydro-3-deoxyphosphogluconate aldolase/(4S)-4-hydroxy-2-oxoglutarate aldolase|uniref:Bifunctional 4-hydroxy-2-oxoglutarate aldolase/2-dehydro-3-deoxy-phosphogluconate aldolase n=1 Tax=Mammaliicoccus lentus TaxID=42858 RepID=A0AAP1RS80_MAMLE|nr:MULTISPECIES: bifunctional 4-hydroxy-2-oxoglutarate aldolase/2-dehydro-3-deoxy-phosphogluconate aldolase [Mammaliicoccus]HBV03083.1 2-dehydro-3-deoxyphosphogluconate aldolase [Staphylococcus sp.]MBF0748409.1 bifunctional 4-hydroxy-2-oxoglutarate aldolase/2-dehydro-3-deoxy-phosphogluconate aldolase [Mammaliicoccus lentus]MBF0794529.1 bifunctional 4-hydroxy-2-oxoglutarate aldolase/2-dehydro-3-deoxy-phosphogluconate aldolase [Mammaliicoccus lentus]MBF0841867.1 bifunctional 4-hydroxy-2-oxoglutar
MDTLNTIKETKIIAIIRNAKPDDILPIVKSLYKSGIRAIEITMNSPKALESIELVATEMKDKVVVGAGTVLDAESARLAILSGATFILSPTLNKETIQMTKKYGAVSIPGALSPTEILDAYEYGGDIIKVFPTTSMGPEYIKDLQGPLPQIPLLPTGGIDLNNIEQFMKAGAVGVGLGSSLVNTKLEANEEYYKNLEETAKQFSDIVHLKKGRA